MSQTVPCRCCDGNGFSTLMPRVNGRLQAVHVECGACFGLGRIPIGGGDAWAQVQVHHPDGKTLPLSTVMKGGS
jgi:hypothetical protein